MKTSLFLFLLFAIKGFAINVDTTDYQKVTVVASGGSPIPVAYSATNTQSRVMKGMAGKAHVKVLCVTGPCDSSMDLAIDVKHDAVAPPDNTSENTFRAKTIGEIDDFVNVGGSVYIRSLTGSPITTGSYDIVAW